jgi:conjugative relaxase-like TrwC/TraI family protein
LNYYAEGGEPLPLYHGMVAQELGLSGVEHDRKVIERLCAGCHPEAGKALVRNAGRENRYVGEDLTFSAPKSVSVAFALADDELRNAIRQKHLSAVKQALDFLESEAGFARVGAQGQKLVKTGLLFALFEHGTSRAMDPQLHTHALLINLTRHADGRFTAIESSEVYRYQMAAGAIYRAALAHGMQQLGFEVQQRKVGSSIGFELTCIPRALVDEFSKRRAEIEAELKLRVGSLDAASPRYAELVALETRRKKELEKPRAELIKEWQEVGREFGVDAETLGKSLSDYQSLTPQERDERKQAIFREGIEALSEGHAHWNKPDLIRALAERATGRITARDVRELAQNKLRSPELIELGELRIRNKSLGSRRYVERYEERYSTPEIKRCEQQMLRSVERIVRGPSTASRADFVEEAIERRPTLQKEENWEQAEAIRYLTSGPGVRVLSGIAGTGKTFTLAACVEVWRREGREVYGASFQKITATRLGEAIGDGISCDTVHSTLYRLDNGFLTLSPGSVVVLDESAMLGTTHLARLVRHVERAQGRIVLVGDAKQLQPLTQGGAHKYLASVLGEKRLENVKRQDEVWAREAVRDMERGEVEAAMKAYVERGRVHVTETRDEAIGRLIGQWKKDGGIENPERVYLIASTNHEVKQINLAAQAQRIRAGLVDPEKKLYANGVFFHPGDRLQYKLNSRVLGVDNADLATVVAVDPERQRITTRLDKDGREITVDLKRYSPEKIVLGYASTTHAAQGASIDHVHVLMGGGATDLHMGYVQLSRSKVSTHVFLNKHTAGDPFLSDLLRSLSRERQKTLAHEVLREHEERQRQSRGLSVGL